MKKQRSASDNAERNAERDRAQERNGDEADVARSFVGDGRRDAREKSLPEDGSAAEGNSGLGERRGRTRCDERRDATADEVLADRGKGLPLHFGTGVERDHRVRIDRTLEGEERLHREG